MKYTQKQLFIRLFEKVKDVRTVAISMGMSRDDYLTWVADDDLFCAKIAELIETFHEERFLNQRR